MSSTFIVEQYSGRKTEKLINLGLNFYPHSGKHTQTNFNGTKSKAKNVFKVTDPLGPQTG